MSNSPGSRYSIRHAGELLEVEAPVEGAPNTARLLVDGERVDEQQVGLAEKAALTYGDLTVEVQWWWTDKVGRCRLVEKDPDARTPLDPPPGTRAARLAELQRAHPVAYASRHVLIAVAQVALVALGIGFVLGRLLPHLDLSWIPKPNLPEIPWPQIPWPDVGLPDIALPGWLAAILASKKWWFPIAVAVFVAVREVDRRKKRTAERAERERGAEPEGSG